ncbi:DUF2849 domain-containing protein [Xanthobacter sp. DSM 24535]|uniref:DUF2849 domain-containing protein n=1 Tax=Roseixanthobacter psychrophilus TaxID=3119917 RepID=UPI003726BCA2
MTSPLQQKLKILGPTVITANRLSDGVSVWLTPTHEWSQAIADAAVATTSEQALVLLTAANGDENRAVGAYAASATLGPDGTAAPANLRERIRVYGPTIPLDSAA